MSVCVQIFRQMMIYTRGRGRNNEALTRGEQVEEIRTMKQVRNEEGTRQTGIKQIIKVTQESSIEIVTESC